MNRTHRPPRRITSAVLAGRLSTGERMIESATDPERRARLTDFWLCLLADYEAAVDAEREQDDEVPA